MDERLRLPELLSPLDEVVATPDVVDEDVDCLAPYDGDNRWTLLQCQPGAYNEVFALADTLFWTEQAPWAGDEYAWSLLQVALESTESGVDAGSPTEAGVPAGDAAPDAPPDAR